MIWIFIALLPPLLYALTNHTDKYLIEKYFKGGGIGALIIFSGLFSIIVLPIIYFLAPEALAVSPATMLILAGSGALVVLSILCYLYALQADEASVVIPFYQTIPIFAYILGLIVLGESLTGWQFFGSALVLLGASILALNLEGEEGGWHFRKRVVLLMLLASLMYALNSVIFKFFALDLGFWPSLFWDSVGKVLVGLLFLLLVPVYRREFLTTIRANRPLIFLLNSTNEILTILADSIAGYAILLAPLALVSVVLGGFQPVFVFAIGILLTLFLPQLGTETLSRRSLIQRLIAIILVVAGTAFFG